METNNLFFRKKASILLAASVFVCFPLYACAETIENAEYQGAGAAFERGVNVTSSDVIEYVDNSTFTNYSANYSAGINNEGKINTVSNSTFEGNHAGITNQNGGTIDSITNSTFKNNSSFDRGAGIHNYENSTINAVDCDFTGNNAINYGAAILNDGTMGTINGNFTNNTSNQAGGAIYNGGLSTIDRISGYFSGNSATNQYGGAICNHIEGVITEIVDATFENNYSGTNGGAIYNYVNAEIVKIEANFIGNSTGSVGAAIYNASKIGTINGNFIENSAINGSAGAIFNQSQGTIDSINGVFTKNTAGRYFGGAISNDGKIGTIEGEFRENYAPSSGGVVSNNINGTIESINGKFISNSSGYDGGAISAGGKKIGSITGEFIGNVAAATGGAISNSNEIDIISGNFSKNSANRYHGGAIYNRGSIQTLEGNFDENVAADSGGAMLNNGSIQLVNGVFNKNAAQADGGAIDNEKNIQTLTGTFAENSAQSHGGAIYNYGTIEKLEANFTKNSSESGGAIYNIGEMTNIKANFIENEATTGGAIFIANHDHDDAVTSIEGSFINNKADKGAAIYSSRNVTLIAKDGGQSIVSGNTGLNGDNVEAIYMDDGATLTLKATNKGTIQIDDKISGETPYLIYVTGDMSGKVVLNNDAKNADITLDNTNLKFGIRDDIISANTLTLKSGFIDVANNNVNTINLNTFNLEGHTKTNADVDLKNEVMDRFKAENYTISDSAELEVINLNLTTDTNKKEIKILYADSPLAKNVSYANGKYAYGPMKKYEIKYFIDEEDNNGYFGILNPKGGSYKDYNPSVFASSVAATASVYTTQLNSFNYAFRHSDSFMNFGSVQKNAMLNANKYAQGAVVDSEVFSPLYTKLNEQGVWLRPYTNFESIPLKNGPKVTNISYGSLVGYDSDVKKLKNGYNGVTTMYLGYNGASQHYDGVNSTLNGGLLGITETLYRGNFFNAATISTGGGAVISDTMYGGDTYPYLMAGVADKLGYNFEFKDGKVIFQPNLLLSYSFIKTFDYTNAAGIKVNSRPMNAFQIAPGMKLIFNTKNGWQPYLSASMIWNINDKQKVRADGMELPELSLKPYVRYGVGMQKLFNQDKITAWGQALVTNGGINGVGLSFGVRYLLGKDKKTK